MEMNIRTIANLLMEECTYKQVSDHWNKIFVKYLRQLHNFYKSKRKTEKNTNSSVNVD